ncbi:hypothetical protein HPP92_013976 [Vanilla planifolia]|uniref:Uncharacterized protein n=1 Tax=Vanilla planifolia TaxID=51239 RepID=A0A835QJ63_VANPL|nr:hypothetical protein HPP92_013976 [Vanilla planifolia]
MMAAFRLGDRASRAGVPKPGHYRPRRGRARRLAFPPIGPSDDPAFNVISGTSMSTFSPQRALPLCSGRSTPWSPVIIRSAIITTADNSNTAGKPDHRRETQRGQPLCQGCGACEPDQGPPALAFVMISSPTTTSRGQTSNTGGLGAVVAAREPLKHPNQSFDVELNHLLSRWRCHHRSQEGEPNGDER